MNDGGITVYYSAGGMKVQVNKYNVHEGAKVWAKYHDNWCPGKIGTIARSKCSVTLEAKNGKEITTKFSFTDLVFRKEGEACPQ